MDIDNLDKLCRTCLQESDDMINLVDTVITYQSDRISLMEILNSFLINNVSMNTRVIISQISTNINYIDSIYYRRR